MTAESKRWKMSERAREEEWRGGGDRSKPKRKKKKVDGTKTVTA